MMRKINEEYFSYNNMKALFTSFFSYSQFSSRKKYNNRFIFLFFFTLMGILIVFMSNITPQIFYQ